MILLFHICRLSPNIVSATIMLYSNSNQSNHTPPTQSACDTPSHTRTDRSFVEAVQWCTRKPVDPLYNKYRIHVYVTKSNCENHIHTCTTLPALDTFTNSVQFGQLYMVGRPTIKMAVKGP